MGLALRDFISLMLLHRFVLNGIYADMIAGLKKRNATLSALSRQAQCDPHAEMSEENREWIDAPAVVSKASSLACPLSFPSPVAETLPLQPVLPSPWTARGQKQRA